MFNSFEDNGSNNSELKVTKVFDSFEDNELTNSELKVLTTEPSDSYEEEMLTTIDNPFNPFTEFDKWYEYDEFKGYHTTALLASFTRTSNDLSDLDNMNEIKLAINEIVRHDPREIYIKVKQRTKSEYVT